MGQAPRCINREIMKKRTFEFALRILKLVSALPNTPMGRIIASQLGKAGTSVGANYRSACRSRSRAEFIARLGVVEEEADESVFWLELLMAGGIVDQGRLSGLLREANEITAIFTAGRKSARSATDAGKRCPVHRTSHIADRTLSK